MYYKKLLYLCVQNFKLYYFKNDEVGYRIVKIKPEQEHRNNFIFLFFDGVSKWWIEIKIKTLII